MRPPLACSPGSASCDSGLGFFDRRFLTRPSEVQSLSAITPNMRFARPVQPTTLLQNVIWDSQYGWRIRSAGLRPAGGGGENRTRVRSSVPQDIYERSPGFASHPGVSPGTGSVKASRGIESPRRPRRPPEASQRSLRRTPLLLTQSGPAPGINPRLTTLLTQRKPVRDWRL